MKLLFSLQNWDFQFPKSKGHFFDFLLDPECALFILENVPDIWNFEFEFTSEQQDYFLSSVILWRHSYWWAVHSGRTFDSTS